MSYFIRKGRLDFESAISSDEIIKVIRSLNSKGFEVRWNDVSGKFEFGTWTEDGE